jgi:hypothetical protein
MKKIALISVAASLMMVSQAQAATLDLSTAIGLPVIQSTAFTTENNFAPAVVGQLELPPTVMGLPGFVTGLPTKLLGAGLPALPGLGN